MSVQLPKLATVLAQQCVHSKLQAQQEHFAIRALHVAHRQGCVAGLQLLQLAAVLLRLRLRVSKLLQLLLRLRAQPG